MKTFELLDDGTMDTVIQCSHCKEEMRFNPGAPEDSENMNEIDLDDYRVSQAFEIAEEDHECAPFTYSINLDERGCFRATVSDRDDKTVYTILAGDELEEGETSIFEDGFMRNKNDLAGLRDYLISLGIMTEEDDLE